MTDSLKLTEMQRTSIEFERQRHLANWFIKSSPHMATPTSATTTTAQSANGGNGANSNNLHGAHTATAHQSSAKHGSHANSSNNAPVFFLMSSNGNSGGGHSNGKHNNSSNNCGTVAGTPLSAATPTMAGNCNLNRPPPNESNLPLQLLTSALTTPTASAAAACGGGGGGGGVTSALGHLHAIEGRKPKLRRFNSHDTNSNMFSVADFENARLARRNEIEMKQRLQRRMRGSANGGCGIGNGGAIAGYGGGSVGGDYSTGDSKASKYSNESQHEPLSADIFLDRYSLPRVVRISYKTKFSDETLQSSASSNGSSTVTSHSSASGGGGGGGGGVGTVGVVVGSGHNSSSGTNTTSTGTTSSSASSSGHLNTNSGNSHNAKTITTITTTTTTTTTTTNPTATTNGCSAHLEPQSEENGELYLLYRFIRQRHIFHAFNAKTAAANRKKGVLIPQEFPGYFSLINDKGLPTATLYNSLIQLVRERVYKFVSVENLPAFTESQTNTRDSPASEGCLPLYTSPSPPTSNNRPHYVKTTARGGQVFRLLAVFEDGKQDHNAIVGGGCIVGNGSASNKPNSLHGREKEKGRYAQILNENRQILYVSLATKGKFYEIEPGIPQILQKLGGGNNSNDAHKKVNPDCVHRITALVSPNKELPQTLRYISGPSGCASAIPETVCITKIATENVVIACPIEDVEVQSPLHLRKLHLTKEMNLLRCTLGFETEQRMLANPNVQNILKFCQFNCDQFLKMVEVELLNRPVRSGSKSRVEGLKLLKPLHLPKLLRREKTTISAHEKEDSIIFLSKSDLASLEAGKAEAVATLEHGSVNGNRITDKMKVFQSTKKKWFRKQDKQAVVATSNSFSTLEQEGQAKRMSMERYSDISKLLQERFGDKINTQPQQEQESISDRSGVSELGCSDTETTTLATIEQKLKKFAQSNVKDQTLQKSMSLQDIELISGVSKRQPQYAVDTISEAGTDIEDVENRAPLQQSFITEKLYNEFHVKTKQYSKSSSSLHQLLNFSLPQKLQAHEQKRTLAQLKQTGGGPKRLDFNVGEPVTGRRAAGGLSLLAVASNSQNTSLISPLTPTSLIEDDLPYSSVRDSLILSSPDDDPAVGGAEHAAGNICQALHLIDYTKENIYAEICHDASAMGGIPSSQQRDTYSIDSYTHSTQISDDYGDYASLTYPTAITTASTPTTTKSGIGGCAVVPGANGGGGGAAAAAGNAISRVQINCSSSPVSYHTVYLGDQPLGIQNRSETGSGVGQRRQRVQRPNNGHEMRDRAHITTVALEGAAGDTGGDSEAVDNIYNTLK